MVSFQVIFSLYVFVLGSSNLTVEAVEKHNVDSLEAKTLDTISDAGSVGALSSNTFKTWVSNYTDCTNATFNKVVSRFNPDPNEYEREVRC